MHGVGESTAAITIVNALPTGVGCAVGIDLRVRAEVDLHPAGSHGKWDVRIDAETRTPLVIESVGRALRQFAPGSSGSGALAVRSDVPPARGLKSSSAVSSAVILAIARATDARADPADVARLSAEVSRSVGVSATGAFDDALAGLVPGVLVTDNAQTELLQQFPMPAELEVALYLPPGTHRPSPEWAAAFRAESERGRSAATRALRGDWTGAMRENTELVERIIGYDYEPLRTELLRHGAVASGVSGMGPALVAIAPRSRVRELLEVLDPAPGDRRAVAFSTGLAAEGTGAP
ncbi:MAG: shikimate kinase [Thermoplasmata archaeon]